MTVLHVLWQPILLSTVFVFIASSLLHMAIPWHKNDYKGLPDQGKVIDLLRPLAIPPGDYMVPHCTTREEMRTPEFAERMAKGPVMVLTVIPNGPFTMGRSLGLWALYLLAVSYMTAYTTMHGLPSGAGYVRVFHVAGMAAFLGYAAALWQTSIWYHRSWITVLKDTVDGLIYAGLTAGTFGWLWAR